MSLSEGIHFEKRIFHATFATVSLLVDVEKFLVYFKYGHF